MVVILPEYGCHDGALRRVAQVGCDPFVVIVPTVELVYRDGVEPALNEGSAQLIPGLGFLRDPHGLFHGEIEPPLPQQRSPPDAARVFSLGLSPLRTVRPDGRDRFTGNWRFRLRRGYADRPETEYHHREFAHRDSFRTYRSKRLRTRGQRVATSALRIRELRPDLRPVSGLRVAAEHRDREHLKSPCEGEM